MDKLISKGNPFSDEIQLRTFITEVVVGLRHLHASGLIHRDLAARNILLVKNDNGKVTPKIADFGMSRVIDADAEGGKTATTFGPVPWMAPEAIGDLRYSSASDIWSLGITIWEIVTGLDPSQQMDMATLAINIRDNGYHPRIQAFFPPWVVKVLNGCWSTEPLDRLTLDEILRILDPNVVVSTAKKLHPRKKKEADAAPAPANSSGASSEDAALLAELQKLKDAISAAEKQNNAVRREIEAMKSGNSVAGAAEAQFSPPSSSEPSKITKKASKRAWARSVVPGELKNVHDEGGADSAPRRITKKKSSRRNQQHGAAIQPPAQ